MFTLPAPTGGTRQGDPSDRSWRDGVQAMCPISKIWTVVRKGTSDHGRIDVLFANAGLGARNPGKITVSSFDLSSCECQRYDIYGSEGLPLMRDGGSIILTGSTRVRWEHGLQHLQREQSGDPASRRSWTLDLKGTGIRVNVLSPGATATPGLLNGLARTGQKDAMIAGLMSISVDGSPTRTISQTWRSFWLRRQQVHDWKRDFRGRGMVRFEGRPLRCRVHAAHLISSPTGVLHIPLRHRHPTRNDANSELGEGHSKSEPVVPAGAQPVVAAGPGCHVSGLSLLKPLSIDAYLPAFADIQRDFSSKHR